MMHRTESSPFPLLFLAAVMVASLASLYFLTTPWPYVSLVPGLVLVFFLSLNSHTNFWFYAVVFLLPFGAYRALPGATGEIKLHWILSFSLLCYAALSYLLTKQPLNRIRSKLWIWLLLYFVANIIATVFSPYFDYAFHNLMLLGVALMFIGLVMYFTTRQGFERWLPVTILGSISISSVFAVFGSLTDNPFFTHVTREASSGRGTGLTKDPNNMSLMAIFTLPLLVHFALYAKHPFTRALCILLFFVNIFGVVSTYSRGGALMLIIMLLLLFAHHLKRITPRSLGLIIAGLGVSAAIVIALIPPSYWERQASLLDKYKGRSISRRLSYIDVAWDIFKEHPVIGTGPVTFRESYAKTGYAKKFMREGDTRRRYAHNTYLEVLVGSGLIGLGLFLGALVTALGKFTKAKNIYRALGDEQNESLVMAYRLCFISVALYLLIFSDPYHKYLLLNLGLAAASWRIAQTATLAASSALQPASTPAK